MKKPRSPPLHIAFMRKTFIQKAARTNIGCVRNGRYASEGSLKRQKRNKQPLLPIELLDFLDGDSANAEASGFAICIWKQDAQIAVSISQGDDGDINK